MAMTILKRQFNFNSLALLFVLFLLLPYTLCWAAAKKNVAAAEAQEQSDEQIQFDRNRELSLLFDQLLAAEETTQKAIAANDKKAETASHKNYQNIRKEILAKGLLAREIDSWRNKLEILQRAIRIKEKYYRKFPDPAFKYFTLSMINLYLLVNLEPERLKDRAMNILYLIGPTGEGKTTIADSLAFELGLVPGEDYFLQQIKKGSNENSYPGHRSLESVGCPEGKSPRKPALLVVDEGPESDALMRVQEYLEYTAELEAMKKAVLAMPDFIILDTPLEKKVETPIKDMVDSEGIQLMEIRTEYIDRLPNVDKENLKRQWKHKENNNPTSKHYTELVQLFFTMWGAAGHGKVSEQHRAEPKIPPEALVEKFEIVFKRLIEEFEMSEDAKTEVDYLKQEWVEAKKERVELEKNLKRAQLSYRAAFDKALAAGLEKDGLPEVNSPEVHDSLDSEIEMPVRTPAKKRKRRSPLKPKSSPIVALVESAVEVVNATLIQVGEVKRREKEAYERYAKENSENKHDMQSFDKFSINDQIIIGRSEGSEGEETRTTLLEVCEEFFSNIKTAEAQVKDYLMEVTDAISKETKVTRVNFAELAASIMPPGPKRLAKQILAEIKELAKSGDGADFGKNFLSVLDSAINDRTTTKTYGHALMLVTGNHAKGMEEILAKVKLNNLDPTNPEDIYQVARQVYPDDSVKEAFGQEIANKVFGFSSIMKSLEANASDVNVEALNARVQPKPNAFMMHKNRKQWVDLVTSMVNLRLVERSNDFYRKFYINVEMEANVSVAEFFVNKHVIPLMGNRHVVKVLDAVVDDVTYELFHQLNDRGSELNQLQGELEEKGRTLSFSIEIQDPRQKHPRVLVLCHDPLKPKNVLHEFVVDIEYAGFERALNAHHKDVNDIADKYAEIMKRSFGKSQAALVFMGMLYNRTLPNNLYFGSSDLWVYEHDEVKDVFRIRSNQIVLNLTRYTIEVDDLSNLDNAKFSPDARSAMTEARDMIKALSDDVLEKKNQTVLPQKYRGSDLVVGSIHNRGGVVDKIVEDLVKTIFEQLLQNSDKLQELGALINNSSMKEPVADEDLKRVMATKLRPKDQTLVENLTTNQRGSVFVNENQARLAPRGFLAGLADSRANPANWKIVRNVQPRERKKKPNVKSCGLLFVSP